jgi:hypothetical protein
MKKYFNQIIRHIKKSLTWIDYQLVKLSDHSPENITNKTPAHDPGCQMTGTKSESHAGWPYNDDNIC